MGGRAVRERQYPHGEYNPFAAEAGDDQSGRRYCDKKRARFIWPSLYRDYEHVLIGGTVPCLSVTLIRYVDARKSWMDFTVCRLARLSQC